MKLVNISKLLLLSAFVFSTVNALIIDQPGNFDLGGDLTETGTDAIIIQTSNVDLDLNGNIISGGQTGIKVKAGSANVRIRNGFVSNMVGSGISIEENVIGVQIFGVGIAQCGGRGIEILGTDTANQVRNVFVDSVTINACSTSVTSSQVVLMDFANNIVMRNSSILLSGNQFNDVEVVKIKDSQECLFMNLMQKNNIGRALVGFYFDNAKTSFLTDIGISSGLAMTSNFKGIQLSNEASENAFSFCRIVSCTSLAGDAIGVELHDGAHGNALRDVNIAGLNGESAYGFCCAGVGTPSNTSENYITDSNVANLFARSGNAIGVLIARADNSAVGRSRVIGQKAPNGVAAGIMFESGTGGNNWTVVDNRILRNVGSSDSNSFGINVATGSANTFLINRCNDNGSTAANQLAGVPAGAVSLVTPSTVNSATAPWTNIGVTS